MVIERGEMNDAAKNVVDELLGDLDDRSGFDTGLVDPRAMDEWRGRWEVMVSRALEAARAEGYAAAREQAEQDCINEARRHGSRIQNHQEDNRDDLAEEAGAASGALYYQARRIRAMQDGAVGATPVAGGRPCDCDGHPHVAEDGCP